MESLNQRNNQNAPPETSIAEKFQAVVKLGELNSRMKDFYDIWLLSRQHEFQSENLKGAL